MAITIPRASHAEAHGYYLYFGFYLVPILVSDFMFSLKFEKYSLQVLNVPEYSIEGPNLLTKIVISITCQARGYACHFNIFLSFSCICLMFFCSLMRFLFPIPPL